MNPAGIAIAGWPVWFQLGVNANTRLIASRVRSAPRPSQRPISIAVSPIEGVTSTSNSLQLELIFSASAAAASVALRITDAG